MNCLRHWKMKVTCVKAMLNQKTHKEEGRAQKIEKGALEDILRVRKSTERVEGVKKKKQEQGHEE